MLPAGASDRSEAAGVGSICVPGLGVLSAEQQQMYLKLSQYLPGVLIAQLEELRRLTGTEAVPSASSSSPCGVRVDSAQSRAMRPPTAVKSKPCTPPPGLAPMRARLEIKL